MTKEIVSESRNNFEESSENESQTKKSVESFEKIFFSKKLEKSRWKKEEDPRRGRLG